MLCFKKRMSWLAAVMIVCTLTGCFACTGDPINPENPPAENPPADTPPADMFPADTPKDVPDTDPPAALPYTVKITRPDLVIAAEPGYDNLGSGSLIEPGVYTIVEEAEDAEGILWGKLKSGAGWIDLVKAAEEARVPLTAELAGAAKLRGLDCHTFTAEESEHLQKILLRAWEPLSDVRFCRMDLAEEGLQVGKTLYTLGALTADKPLVAGVTFYGDLTTYGISFTDAEGAERLYILYVSGRNGSLVLQEYRSGT